MMGGTSNGTNGANGANGHAAKGSLRRADEVEDVSAQASQMLSFGTGGPR